MESVQSPSTLINADWPELANLQAFSLDATASSNSELDHTKGRNVYKFGGTSVGSPERLCGLVGIVKEERERVIAVVVSAMGKTTDLLLKAVDEAAQGNQDAAMQVVDQLQELSIRNGNETQELILKEHAGSIAGDTKVDDVTELVIEFFKPLRELLFGICLLQEKTPAAMDTVLSFGERLSATIISKLLTKAGVEAVFVDAREWMTTDNNFSCARVLFEESKAKLQKLVGQLEPGVLPVITGFIGREQGGRTTTIGRNGSDYTATIVGASLQADYVVINTDISGVMTADPRIVDRAVALSHLNHHEALELAIYGSGMFHPRTMVPLIHSGVTMLIRNTMDPQGHGTYISRADHTGKKETCTTSLENLAMLEVRTRILQDGSLNSHENIGARITKLMENLKVPVWLSIRGAHGQAVTVVIPMERQKEAHDAIRSELESELESQEVDAPNVTAPVTMLSIVTEEVHSIPFDQTKFFGALADANVDVLAVGQGTSSRSLNCIIPGADTKLAVRRVHDAFNVDYLVTNVAILGCNHITLELLKQLRKEQDMYLRRHRAKIQVVGFGSNCQTFQYHPNGLDLDQIEDMIRSCKASSSVYVADDQCGYKGAPTAEQLDGLQDLSNAILIDCSGQSDTTNLYDACLSRNIHVVVSNARSMQHLPPTSSRESVATVGRRQGRTFFLYSSTVAAGIPVIQTLGNLLRTGDRVEKIEASLSGAVGYVSNQVMKGLPLSQAVKMAIEEGYCEQDPRNDFLGQDVANKIVVLARALHVRLDVNAVEVQPFIPKDVMDAVDWKMGMDVDDVRKGLEAYDDEFRSKYYEPAVAEGKRLRFVATVDFTQFPTIAASVRPELVDEDHPAFQTSDNEIAFGFRTLQYQPRPLVLKGVGTGSQASATGVLRDVTSILTSLQGKDYR